MRQTQNRQEAVPVHMGKSGHYRILFWNQNMNREGSFMAGLTQKNLLSITSVHVMRKSLHVRQAFNLFPWIQANIPSCSAWTF
jgi:hypothetical protein